ncbi:major facilitator superfamily domain-containing protein [Cunninghamella echinulata]|nr:major facilitator superfamily domain-containing protein [Cunninghamella echinulata]
MTEKKEISDTISIDHESLTKTSPKQEKFVYSEAEKRVKRKIDRVFLPLLFMILFTQFVDKSALNGAGVLGIMEDTHITKEQFGWLGALFYVGYIAFQIPNNFLIQRLPTSKYMGIILLLWGVSFTCTFLAKDFGQLAFLRVLLGFFEAVTYPCIFLLISRLYRRHEQIMYISYMFVANASAICLGGLIGYGIGNMHGLHGLSGWQYTYIIWGSITFVEGIIFFIFLPDKAKSRWFSLTPEEERIVDERSLDNGVAENTKFNKAHIWEALRDPKYYCYIFISALCNLQNGSLTVFSSQLIVEFGFTNLQAILLNIPNGLCGCLLIVITTFLSKRYNEICYIGMGMSVVSFLGVLLLDVIPSGPVKLLGIYLAYGCTPVYILVQTSINNNVKGYSKKVFYTSSQLVFYCIGNFVGPLLTFSREAPRYITAMSIYSAANVVIFILYGVIRWKIVRDNRKKQSLDGVSEKSDVVNDLTDVEDSHFVYRP